MHPITKYQTVSCFPQRPCHQSGDSETQRHIRRLDKGGKMRLGKKKTEGGESESKLRKKSLFSKQTATIMVVIMLDDRNYPNNLTAPWFSISRTRRTVSDGPQDCSRLHACMRTYVSMWTCVSWLCRYNCVEVGKVESQGQGGVAHQF